MTDRVLITGGAGQLAREILKVDPTIDAPVKEQLDVSKYQSVARYCDGKNYQAIIHAGAVTNKFDQDVDEEYIQSNIIGTANMVLWAMRNRIRLVYISSDYVYPSERGGYTEESVLLPVNRYAASKLGGEMAVQIYNNSLIIRTSFYHALKFETGCTDQYTSRLPISEAAEAILKLSRMESLRGIVNLGTTKKRSLYEIVRGEFNRSVTPITRADLKIPYIIPSDSSMDATKFQNLVRPREETSRDLRQCRICRSESLHRYLALGRTPLANSYLQEAQLAEPEFKEELTLQLCTNCGLSQLTKVVHPDLMFKNYLYVSSTTRTFQLHCEELARASTNMVSAKPGELVLDIASNDGCLLTKFRDLGMNVLGVDPAENLAAEANVSGIRTLCAYWSINIARDVVSRFGMPKIVTATNVFAHVDDVHEFVSAVRTCLAEKGVFIIEAPYLLDFIEKNEFDTAYHEHLSYLAVHPLAMLMEAHKMQIIDVQYFADLHGGTIRVFVSRSGDYPVSKNFDLFINREMKLGIKARERYDRFAQNVMKNKSTLCELIARLRSEGKSIWAYGASAKGNTLMNFFEFTHDDIPVVIDDNPKKWNYYTPGSKMRIAGVNDLAAANVDYLLLLAWNFQSEIMQRCKAVNYQGGFILPVPEPKIVS